MKTRRDFFKSLVVGSGVAVTPLSVIAGNEKERSYEITSESYGVENEVEFNIRDYGAKGDGTTLDTSYIQKAIDHAAARNGGKIIIPPGNYLVGAIILKSNIHVDISAGATLLGSENFDHYPGVDGRWEGIDRTIYASMFTGHNLKNVSITGRGTINGQGEVWWKAHRETREVRRANNITTRPPENPGGSPLKWPRPRSIYLHKCENVLISGITILDAPAWTIHPVYCENVSVEHITIIQPYESPNTDGINPDSCKNVRIANCYIDCGDDCVTIKSGYNEFGRATNVPCENIVVTNCTFARGRGGVVIGSEMSADVRNITVSNCTFDGTLRGLRIKSARGRGGIVENFRASNLVMRNIMDAAFSITMFYSDAESDAREIDDGTPQIRNIHWSETIVMESDKAADIRGLVEMPIEGLHLKNITVESAKTGFDCLAIKDSLFENVSCNVENGSSLILRQSDEVDLLRCTTKHPVNKTPVVYVEDCQSVLIDGCYMRRPVDYFMELSGSENSKVEIGNNRFRKVKQVVNFTNGASSEQLL